MPGQEPIRVLCVDDHPLLREGIAALVTSQPDMRFVGEAASGREALVLFRQHAPDVTLMDLRLPDMSGIDALERIRAEFPEARVVMLTTFEGDVEIRRALESGARGYLLKSMPPRELLEGIRAVHAGRKFIPPEVGSQLAEHLGEEVLTSREVDVLREIAVGNRNQDIARHLLISEETVKVHVKHIMEKLQASDRTAAVTIAIRRGILHL
jgi:DNA-binding NarL/FixJ family response regulator